MPLDLANLSDISTTNSNYKWLLCGVDFFTTKAYIVPMKNKTASNVTEAVKIILNISKYLQIIFILNNHYHIWALINNWQFVISGFNYGRINSNIYNW